MGEPVARRGPLGSPTHPLSGLGRGRSPAPRRADRGRADRGRADPDQHHRSSLRSACRRQRRGSGRARRFNVDAGCAGMCSPRAVVGHPSTLRFTEPFELLPQTPEPFDQPRIRSRGGRPSRRFRRSLAQQRVGLDIEEQLPEPRRDRYGRRPGAVARRGRGEAIQSGADSPDCFGDNGDIGSALRGRAQQCRRRGRLLDHT